MAKTKAQRGKDAAFRAQVARTRNLLSGGADRANMLRSKDRDFHGLDKEFRYLQAEMQAAYEKSRDVRHPRDKGDIRESILRRFLVTSGYLPQRYQVSDRSIRVASTSGHVSGEIDIAIYDRDSTVTLMKREESYEVLAVESVHGVIQVKSNLGRKEIREGLENLATFKSLRKSTHATPFRPGFEARGFSILFAYESSLEWADIASEFETFAKSHPNEVWTNALFVLNRGHMMYGSESMGSSLNSHIESFDKPVVYGIPDWQTPCLYPFQSIILQLLTRTPAVETPFGEYHTLPLVSGAHSYSFFLGPLAEVGTCETHGIFSRTISQEKLEMVLVEVANHEPMMSSEILASLSPITANPTNDKIWVYNPEGHPLRELLFAQSATISGITIPTNTFDIVSIDGRIVWIPVFYSAKDVIVSDCPQCQKRDGLTPKRGRKV